MEAEPLTAPRSYVARLAAQTSALTAKNVAIFKFRWLTALLMIAMPVAMILGMYGLYNALTSIDTAPHPLTLTKCVSYDVFGNVMPDSAGPPCVTLVYAPDGPRTRAIMQLVAADGGLQFGTDVLPQPTLGAMADFVFTSLGSGQQVDVAVEFNTTGLGAITYALWVNNTRLEAAYYNGLDAVWKSSGAPGRLMAIQRAIDGAIIAETAAELDAAAAASGVHSASSTGTMGPQLDMSTTGMRRTRSPAGAPLGDPIPTLDITFAPFTDYESGLSGSLGPSTLMVAIAGSTFPIVGIVLSSIFIMTMVTGEKARRLVGALRTIGLLDSAYWASWLLGSLPVLLLLALVAAGVGVSTGIELYTRADYSVHFVGMFMLATSTTSMALCCSSFVRSQRAVNVTAFCFFAIAATTAVLFVILGLYTIIYSPNLPPIIAVTVAWLPSFHYGRLINTMFSYIYTPVAIPSNITMSAVPNMPTSFAGFAELARPTNFPYRIFAPTGDAPAVGGAPGGAMEVGRQFTWSMLSQSPPATLVLVDGQMVQWSDHAPSFDLLMMLALTGIYLVVAWYLGQVCTGDLGAAQPFYFPLSPYYWGVAKIPSHVEAGDTLGELQRLSAIEGSIRVHKVSKSYGAATALKEVSMVLPPGQVTCILGHNGAGKSTLIHVLTGLIAPSEGEAFIFGKSVRTDMQGLRQDIGITPQDDLLWQELSPTQHLELFARFKSVRGTRLSEHVTSLLQLVKLDNVRDSQVDTFSGGMKRRLSIALGAVGDVKLLVLDEPASGLDPLSRRRVHGMIESLKPGRIIVLTTHAMDEADQLGDSVAIMANGRLRAYGTPLFLKNRFGAGYQINILTTPDRVPQVKALVKSQLPGAEFVGDAAAGEDSVNGVLTGAGGMGFAAGGQFMVIPGQAPGQIQLAPIAAPAGAAPGMYLAPAIPGAAITVPGAAEQATTPAASVAVAAAVSTGANSSDLLQSQRFSGAVTVAVPRSLLPAIPAFLRTLTANTKPRDAALATNDAGDGERNAAGAPLVSEFGIANSTLEEVFLRLAANATEVNAGIAIAGGGPSAPAVQQLPMLSPLASPTSPGAIATAVGGFSPLSTGHKMCALCGASTTSPVTLFNSRSVAVTAPDLICAPCADRTLDEIDRVVASSGRGAKGADFAPVPTTGSAGAASAGGAGVELAPLLPTASPAAAAVDDPVNHDAAAGAPPASRPTSHRVPQQAVPVAIGAINTAGATIAHKPAGSWRPKRRRTSDLDPISFWSQCGAICLLRLQLQSKQRWANACYVIFVIIGAFLTVIVTPSAKPASGTHCVAAGGFYVSWPQLCNQANFSAALATDFSTQMSYSSPPSDGIDAVPSVLQRVAAPTAAGPQQQQQVSQFPSILDTPHALYKPQCMHYNPDFGYCEDPGMPPVVPDWQQAQFTYINGWNSAYKAMGTNVIYVDGPDPSDVPLTSYDLLGVGIGNMSVPSYATFINLASNAPTVRTTSDLDGFVNAAQRTIEANSGLMPYPCDYYGEWDQGNWIGWYFNDSSVATAWYSQNIPSVGLVMRRSRPGDASPSFAYDMRQWALYSNGGSSPPRGNTYTWTSIYQTKYGSCYPSQLNSVPMDNPFDGNSWGEQTPGPAALSALHNAFLRQVVADRGAGGPNGTIPKPFIRTAYVPMPEVSWAPANPPDTSNIQSLLWPLFTLFLLPIFVFAISHEKANKLHAMLTMAGMRASAYMLGHYLFSVGLFLVIGGIYCIAGYAAGVAVFRHTNPGVFVALLLTWGHSQAGWGIFLGSALRNPRAATIASYMLIIIVAVASFLLSMFLKPWPTSLTWVPFLSYTRAATLLLTFGAETIQAGSELQGALLITAFEGTLALAVGIYLHAVLAGPESTGVVRHPLYPLHAARRYARVAIAWCSGNRVAADDDDGFRPMAATAGAAGGVTQAPGMRRSGGFAPLDPSAAASGLTGRGNHDDAEDPDVTAERARINDGAADDAPVLIHNLVKTFPARLPSSARAAGGAGGLLSAFNPARYGIKHAVDGVTLAVDRGACLGLLGVNGAGKTTTISCITGNTPLTSGEALVNGFDVTTQMDQVWRSLGICPQFDALWDVLTVREHLWLYARIKGIPQRRLKAVVQRVAEKVGLDGDAFNQPSSGLSGGMRRRLSIGIALIGEPSVVVFDEPTTGVDPAARRDIWRIIQGERQRGCAMLLTTHSMEEADALCSRIAIMHGGKLRCVGNQLRLKARFGDGYKLTVTGVSDAALSAAEAFIKRTLCPAAQLLSRTGLTLCFLLPHGSVDVADVFQTMETHKAALGIQDAGLTMTTLDEVFVKVVEAAERAHADGLD